MEDIDNFITIMIVVCVLVGVLKFVLWFVAMRQGALAVNQFFNAYNQAVESQLIQIAYAIQQHERQQVIWGLRSQASEQIQRLPRQQRRVYERRLSDVMSAKTRVNPRTGELEG